MTTFLFLIETKALSNKLHAVRRSLGFEGLFTMDPVERKGDLFFSGRWQGS